MIKSEEDRWSLQQDLDTLQKCEDQWLMQFHPENAKFYRLQQELHYSPSIPSTDRY
jgi:hypothetical protein